MDNVEHLVWENPYGLALRNGCQGAAASLAAIVVGAALAIPGCDVSRVAWASESGIPNVRAIDRGSDHAMRVAVVEANSKVISQNTSATDAIHISLEGVRADVRGLSMQIASQPCQAEEISDRMVEEMRQVKDKPPPGPA
jgi:acyl transferase domain-containing protein